MCCYKGRERFLLHIRHIWVFSYFIIWTLIFSRKQVNIWCIAASAACPWLRFISCETNNVIPQRLCGWYALYIYSTVMVKYQLLFNPIETHNLPRQFCTDSMVWFYLLHLQWQSSLRMGKENGVCTHIYECNWGVEFWVTTWGLRFDTFLIAQR